MLEILSSTEGPYDGVHGYLVLHLPHLWPNIFHLKHSQLTSCGRLVENTPTWHRKKEFP
jgi:hypothetical protein